MNNRRWGISIRSEREGVSGIVWSALRRLLVRRAGRWPLLAAATVVLACSISGWLFIVWIVTLYVRVLSK